MGKPKQPTSERIRLLRWPGGLRLKLSRGEREFASEMSPAQAAGRGAALEDAIRGAQDDGRTANVDLGGGLVASVGPRGVSYRVEEGAEVHFSTASFTLDKALALAKDLQTPASEVSRPTEDEGGEEQCDPD